MKDFTLDGNTETIILHHGDLVNSVTQQQKCNLLAADHSSKDKRAGMCKKTLSDDCKHNKVETTNNATATFLVLTQSFNINNRSKRV